MFQTVPEVSCEDEEQERPPRQHQRGGNLPAENHDRPHPQENCHQHTPEKH